MANRKPDGIAMGEVGGDLGAKKDGTIFLLGGRHAKGTRVSGA